VPRPYLRDFAYSCLNKRLLTPEAFKGSAGQRTRWTNQLDPLISSSVSDMRPKATTNSHLHESRIDSFPSKTSFGFCSTSSPQACPGIHPILLSTLARISKSTGCLQSPKKKLPPEHPGKSPKHPIIQTFLKIPSLHLLMTTFVVNQ